ncbi:MAG TPA: DUF1259 domain-containing protein [Steroidobacteraceae bacterium]|jgi:hypothetical protein|nr:DUF1259 domain-containing protein [Steroidobacteraceae bacterium]
MPRIFSVLICSTSLAISIAAHAGEGDWSKVDQLLGRKGATPTAEIHRYGFPRSDLHVTVDGVTLKPAFALGGWAAFETMPSGGSMLMGDLVLLDTEISPVMKKLLDEGLEVSAIHNHLLRTSVPIFYMHVGGHGEPVKLAQSLRAALALSKTPLAQTAPATPPPPVDLDTPALERSLGGKSSANGGVCQFGFPRAEAITEDGMAVPPPMGTATAINFQPTGPGNAAITGDFVLISSEVDPVMKTLRQNGIEVTALHSHMVGESPRLYFMHFWANGDAQKLAHGLRAALDVMNLRRGS